MSTSGALVAVALLVVLAYVPGWALVRASGIGDDAFTRLWAGIVVLSIAGLALAQAGRFSLATLLGVAGAVTVTALAARARGGGSATATQSDCGMRGPTVRVLAAVSALVTLFWTWPPYETVIAASDSTMYLNAGEHIARTGAYDVRDTVGTMLPPELARPLFTALGLGGATGPFVRLPGGLLKQSLDDPVAVPAFFPLLPVWVAVGRLVGGTTGPFVVTPLMMALAVAALVLFAGETLGAAVAAFTAVVFCADFAVWWYAKFTMPEALATAAIWAGFVVAHRAGRDRDGRAALLAGLIFGVAGLARTETFLFLAAAGALAYSWHRPRTPIGPLALGFASVGAFAASIVARSPSHHLAYLRNDVLLNYAFYGVPLLAKARASGALYVAALVLALVVVGTVAFGRRAGVGAVRSLLRMATLVGTMVAVGAYLKVAYVVYPRRDVAWLAAYGSWPLLALAVPGLLLAWRRGGDGVRLALYAALLESVVFVLNPRVAPYQPWAIRRFLPLVLPAITVTGSVALAWIAGRRARGARVAAIAVAAVVVVLEVAPVLRVRAAPYWEDSTALVDSIAERFPRDAIVAVDSDLADLQLQVPLWLRNGRETLMLREGGVRWRDVIATLVASGRPVFWIAKTRNPPSDVRGVRLEPLLPDPDLVVAMPEAPPDTLPVRTVRRLVWLRLYRVVGAERVVGTGAGDAPGTGVEPTGVDVGSVFGSMCLASAYSSGVTTRT